MAITAPRLIGRNLTVTADGGKTIWTNLRATIRDNTDDATAADSTLDEVVRTQGILEGELSGFLGAVNNGGTLPAKGDSITDFAVTAGADSVIPDISGFTNIKVLSVQYDFARGPATFNLQFRSGVLN